MKNKLVSPFFLLLVVFFVGCTRQQTLPFSFIEESVAFPTEEKDIDKLPQLILIADANEISQLEFAETLSVYLEDIDFSQSFVLLVLRGELEDSGLVEEVVRISKTVIVRTSGINPGPGSFVLSGYTHPYQIIKVEKLGLWNDVFNFQLERDDAGVVSEREIFVP